MRNLDDHTFELIPSLQVMFLAGNLFPTINGLWHEGKCFDIGEGAVSCTAAIVDIIHASRAETLKMKILNRAKEPEENNEKARKSKFTKVLKLKNPGLPGSPAGVRKKIHALDPTTQNSDLPQPLQTNCLQIGNHLGWS